MSGNETASAESTDNREDPTALGDNQVVDRFLAASASKPELGVAGFFQENPTVDRDRHLVTVIVADIRHRQKHGQEWSPRFYFQTFDGLSSNADAWKILDAAESWLNENEGERWAASWVEEFPDVAQRFAKPMPNSGPSTDRDDPNLDDLKPGDVLRDFEILRFIGEGAFGRVYLANDLSLGRQCALKVTVDQGSEGQVLASLNHAGIVQVYSEQSIHGKKLLSMQFVDGQSLAEWIQDKSIAEPSLGKSSPANGSRVQNAVRIVRDVASALSHAHGRGVLHHDIKPANVLISKSGQPMLSDFNVATSSDFNSRFSLGGTINYMAPEQLQAVCLNDASAEERVDIRSDVYSLGVVLLESITGSKAWNNKRATNSEAATHQLLASRIRSGPPSIAGHYGVTSALAAIVDKALRPNANDRYQTAAELETDLTDWLSNRNNTHAVNPSIVERSSNRFRRHGYWWTSVAVAFALLFAAASYAVVIDGRQLKRSSKLAKQARNFLSNGRLTQASDSLGQAKAQLQQVWLAGWFQSDRYDEVSHSLFDSSRRISIQEADRFTSLFGEISLRKVHQRQPSELTNLIKVGLRAYKVMQTNDWQQQAPFSDLPDEQRLSVAEGITELMLVSMHESAKQTEPTLTQVQEVLGRLPFQHRELALFERVLETKSVLSQPYNATTAAEPFESYLHGVIATMEGNPDDAANWYSRALRDHESDQPQRFWWHYRHAYTCQSLQRHEEAFIHYGICLGLQPNFAWPKFNMGLACLDIGNPSLAATYIKEAIKADPKFTAAYVALIAIQVEQKQFQAAIMTYDESKLHDLSSPELDSNFQIAKRKYNQSQIESNRVEELHHK